MAYFEGIEMTGGYGNGPDIINSCSVTVNKGEIVSILGPNGAGKTTLFNILLDLIRPTTGSVINNDISVHKSESWKTFTGSFIDESFLISYLTPEEYFQFIGDLRGINKADIKEFLGQFDEFFNDEV